MLLLSRFLQRFHKNEKQKQDTVDGVPCIGDKGKPYRCKIILLDDTELVIDIRSGAKGQVLLERVVSHLNLIEKDYFGLRFLDHTGQTQWLDPVKSISSQLKSPPPQPLYFGVKFYAADPCKLHEEITRYQFFLQVKRDVLQGRLPVPFDLSAELAAFAVQSELGDYDPKRYSPGYVSELRFIPNQTEEFENQVMQIHRSLVGQVPSTAEWKYLERVKWLDMYGVDLHPVLGDGSQEYFLCLTPSGVVIYRHKLTRMATYFWPRISKITYKGKMFILRIRDKNNDENTYAFECSNKSACKHLWKCCVEHHAFFRLTTASNSYSHSGKLISLGSKYRYSGRTEKQVLAESMNRPAPQVVRTPSRRHQRRNSTGTETHGSIPPAQSESYLAAPEPIKTRSHTVHKRELGYQSAPDSPRSTRSAPWERKGGLFTCPDSPTSVVSAKLFPGRRPMPSESEAESVASTHYRNRRHRMRDSESESEVSHRQRRGHRSRCPAETDGSESEASHRHRHRKSRHSQDNLTGAGGSEAQWQATQSRIRDQAATGGYPMRPNGSLNSMVSEQSAASKRARRRRSRSPGNKQPPAELAQHFKYVDPEAEGMDNQQMRQLDLQFTTVETNTVQLASKVHKHRARSKDRRSMPDLSEQATTSQGATAAAPTPVPVPSGEPPPPYTDSPARPHPQRPHSMQYQHPPPSYNLPQPTNKAPSSASSSYHHHRQPQHYHQQQQQQQQQYRSVDNSMMNSPVSIQMNTTHTAPIVKTKPVSMMTPPKPQYHVPVPVQPPPPTTTVIFGNYGNSAVVNTTNQYQQYQQQQQQKQQQQQQQKQQQAQASARLANHARDDSGVGIESPQDSSSGSQQTTPTYTKPAYSEQVSSRPRSNGGLRVSNLPPPTGHHPQQYYRGHSEKTTDL